MIVVIARLSCKHKASIVEVITHCIHKTGNDQTMTSQFPRALLQKHLIFIVVFYYRINYLIINFGS